MKIPKHIFKGSEKDPFLAPRGIFVHDSIVGVCDTAHNRVFIWTDPIASEFQEPNIILGSGGREASNATFYYPSGLWTDGKKLIVADAWNHRVLIWNEFPSQNFQPADVVIGQRDFQGNLPNTVGVNSSCDASTLYWCYGVFSDGISLWIADTGNRRVLFFETIPTQNFQAADDVIGQPDFFTKDLSPHFSTWPYSIKVSHKGELLISDTQFFRVLYWDHWRKAKVQSPDVIFGQNNLVDNGQNQFRMSPNAYTLNWVYDAIFDNKGGVYIADTGNSRILYWKTIPKEHNAPADEIFGQKNFEMLGENKESIMGEAPFLYWPFSISYSDSILWVCETGNNRIYTYL